MAAAGDGDDELAALRARVVAAGGPAGVSKNFEHEIKRSCSDSGRAHGASSASEYEAAGVVSGVQRRERELNDALLT